MYCTVDNCHYWADGNHCTAEKILITSDKVGGDYPQAADVSSTADIVRQHGHTPAQNCMETCCKTFTDRDQGRPANAPRKMENKARDLAQKY